MNKTCDACGMPFAAVRSSARWCANACRQKAMRRRKVGVPERVATLADVTDTDYRAAIEHVSGVIR